MYQPSEHQTQLMLCPIGASVVERRSASGYRLVVRSRSRYETPVVETLATAFATVEEAIAHAEMAYGIPNCRVQARCTLEL